MVLTNKEETICALITPPGKGAIGVIRLSGPGSFLIGKKIFKSTDRNFSWEHVKSHVVVLGKIMDEAVQLDEVLITFFKNPRSYTGDDVMEISCHGSLFIQQKILELIQRHGARMARAGEFTMRAFLNGKLDLVQAEAVADIIDSENQQAHQAALQQMRGGYSAEIKKLRDELIRFAALLELELDFSEEDVEFANRHELVELLKNVKDKIKILLNSFAWGNVLKNGIPVVIAGKPNVGKSTLLNALINEERAIVSEIAGTTRDTIEEVVNLNGLRFRFIDTAGIRKTTDAIESIGVKRALNKVGEATLIIYVFDPSETTPEELKTLLNEIQLQEEDGDFQKIKGIIVANKIDFHSEEKIKPLYKNVKNLICISAKNKWNLDVLKQTMLDRIHDLQIESKEGIVTNARHAHSLQSASDDLKVVMEGVIAGKSIDLIASDIRQAIQHLGEITGQVSSDELLDFIFSKFCIGK
jgi:tRNA modification GTPase